MHISTVNIVYNMVHGSLLIINLGPIAAIGSRILSYLPKMKKNVYRTRANVSRGLYFFYSIFTLPEAYIADNLCTKNENSSFFKQKIRSL